MPLLCDQIIHTHKYTILIKVKKKITGKIEILIGLRELH